ncbi:hypothetical protein H5410_052446 [Solanum commersonii]|uniref:Uncharacterized protein n=1 Tax=Solanum commersonii TaxID=4109 RepID=A0A9J5X147_SOLCO|nr:hypothetical protein H5410_052446 [Solanum commersonii]
MVEKLLMMEAWRSSGDENICVVTRKRSSRGVEGSHGHRGDSWWNREVQGKMKAMKDTYVKLVDSTDAED